MKPPGTEMAGVPAMAAALENENLRRSSAASSLVRKGFLVSSILGRNPGWHHAVCNHHGDR